MPRHLEARRKIALIGSKPPLVLICHLSRSSCLIGQRHVPSFLAASLRFIGAKRPFAPRGHLRTAQLRTQGITEMGEMVGIHVRPSLPWLPGPISALGSDGQGPNGLLSFFWIFSILFDFV